MGAQLSKVAQGLVRGRAKPAARYCTPHPSHRPVHVEAGQPRVVRKRRLAARQILQSRPSTCRAKSAVQRALSGSWPAPQCCRSRSFSGSGRSFSGSGKTGSGKTGPKHLPKEDAPKRTR